MAGLKSLFKRKGAVDETLAEASVSHAPAADPEVAVHSPSPIQGPKSTLSPMLGMVKSNASMTSLSSSTSNPVSRASSLNGKAVKGKELSRFTQSENGEHVHYLKNARRQEKLTRMLRDIMGGTGQRVHNDAVSAVPEFVKNSEQLSLMTGLVSKVQAGQIEMGLVNGATLVSKHPKGANAGDADQMSIKQASAQSLVQKYGKCQEVIGKGSYGVVRVSHKFDSSQGREMLYAVKQFRRRGLESEHSFQERLMSEFCISSALHHHNIIHTFDLMKDTHGACCQIMEYCPGGDLYSLILSTGTGLSVPEADCFFKQILRGVTYMHSMGVAHCDLKPENILLTQDGTCKISDFGNGECFRMAWEKNIHLSNGVYGSGPYIAPEEFKDKPFDPRAVDIWAMGIIYMAMRTGAYLWRTADPDGDEFYAQYLHDRKTSRGYAPIEKLTPSKCVYVIYSILDPVPSRRITGKQVLNSEWGRSIRVCDAGEAKGTDSPRSGSQGPEPDLSSKTSPSRRHSPSPAPVPQDKAVTDILSCSAGPHSPAADPAPA